MQISAFTSFGFSGSVVGQSPWACLAVKLRRVSGGNSELLTPASEWVVWWVSLLPWNGLWLGKCTLFTLSSGLEDMHRVRKVSPVWAEEGKSAVGGGNPSSRSSLCRPGEWLGDSCFFGLAPHLGTGFCVLVSEGDWLFYTTFARLQIARGRKNLLSLAWCKAQNIHKK